MSMTEPPVPHEPPVLNRQPHIRVAKSSYGGGLLRKLNASIRSNWYHWSTDRVPARVGSAHRGPTETPPSVAGTPGRNHRPRKKPRRSDPTSSPPLLSGLPQ